MELPHHVQNDSLAVDQKSNLHAIGEGLCFDWGNLSLDDLDLTSVHRLASFQVSVNVFVVVPLCVGGFVGNVLSIVVLRLDNISVHLSLLLQALAVADNAYLIGCLLFQTLRTVVMATNWLPDSSRDAYYHMEPYIWPLASVAQTASVWLVTVVTLDRYMAICRPTPSRPPPPPPPPLTSALRVRGAVVAVFVVALLFNIPGFFELETYSIRCDNLTVTVSDKTELRRNRIYVIVYEAAAYFLFRLGLPLAVVSVLNFRLIVFATRCGVQSGGVVLKRHGRTRDRRSVTLLLVSMVTVFIVCELPDLVFRIVLTVFYATDQSTESLSIHYWTTVTNLMLTVNSSANCVVYCLSGRQFRRILRRQLMGWMGRRGMGSVGGSPAQGGRRRRGGRTGSTAIFGGSSLT